MFSQVFLKADSEDSFWNVLVNAGLALNSHQEPLSDDSEEPASPLSTIAFDASKGFLDVIGAIPNDPSNAFHANLILFNSLSDVYEQLQAIMIEPPPSNPFRIFNI